MTFFNLFLTMFLWSSAFIAIKLGLGAVDNIYLHPISIVYLRFLVCLIIITPVYLFTKNKTIPKSIQEIFYLISSGLLVYTVYNISLNYAELYIDPTICSFFLNLIPIYFVFLSAIILSEQITKSKVIGVATSIIGAILTFGALYHGAAVFTSLIGIACLIIYPVSFTLGAIFQKSLITKGYKPIELIFWNTLVGFISVLFATKASFTEIAAAPANVVISVIYLALFCSLLAFYCWAKVLEKWEVSLASTGEYFIPFFVFILSAVILKTYPSIMAFIGGMITLLGAVIVQVTPILQRKR